MKKKPGGGYYRIVLQDPESGSESFIGALSRPRDDVPWHFWIDLDGWGLDARVPVAAAAAPALVDAIAEARTAQEADAERNLPEALARMVRGEDPATGKRPLSSLVRKTEKLVESDD